MSDAIEASSVGVRTMADGTLRLSIDIEPRHAQDAFRLFGAPGTPLAIAALKTAAQQVPAVQKGGPISCWLALRCKEPEFQQWLGEAGEAGATLRVREMCGVDSRAEIDNDEHAMALFETQIRCPWLNHTHRTTR